MSWQGILGHDGVVSQFRCSLSRGRLASTYLFVGSAGVGKRAFAFKLAQALLCSESPASELNPCGRCPSCVQVLAGTHPDLLRVAKPKEKSELPVSLLIGDLEHRMQQGLCHDISLKPFMGGRRVAIIEDADYLNEEGANCLLKTLEEPPPRSVMILIGTSPEQQLPTIRSRSQIVRFQPLSEEIVAQLLLEQGAAGDETEARRLAAFSEGSLQRASELSDPQLWEFRRQLYAQLAKPRWDQLSLAKSTAAFIDAAGKEAPPRRARFRHVVRFAADFYREVARRLARAAASKDDDLARAAEAAVAAWPADAEQAADCVSRCLDALEQIDRNANQAALVEGWLDDLGQLAAGKALIASSAGTR